MKRVVAASFFLFAVFSLSGISAAQSSIKIIRRKVVYKRTGENAAYNPTFVVERPIISGAISPQVKRKIENAVSYWRVFETNLKDCLSGDEPATSFSYKINYNKNGFLDVSLTEETNAAYPDEHIKTVVVNLKTGRQIFVADLIKSVAANRFAREIQKRIRAELRASKLNSDDAFVFKNQLTLEQIGLKNLNGFSIGDKGVTFLFDYEFNHASRSEQPAGRYFFSYSQLIPFLKPNGLLVKLAR